MYRAGGAGWGGGVAYSPLPPFVFLKENNVKN
jgi:hypothetical protein